ncbi:MAG: hypothetical protein ACHQ51_15140 [Elusimicrobiota bacterium]
MKTSLRRAATTFAALSLFCVLPAAAQVVMDGSALGGAFDDARASVLKGIAGAKSAAAKAVKPAPAAPPAAAEADWQKIIAKLKDKGEFKPANAQIPANFGLEDKAGDAKAAHSVDRINAFGEINPEDGLFNAEMVGIASEKWTLGADGNWTVDIWIFSCDVYGAVRNAAHLIRVVAPDLQGTVSVKSDKLTPADPRIQAQFDVMTRHWAGARP